MSKELLSAVRFNDISKAMELLKNGTFDVNYQDDTGNSPLIAGLRSTVLVKRLLKSGAKIELKNNLGRTALAYACDGFNEESVRVLIRANADIETRDNFGNTPLLIATESSLSDENIALLLDEDAKVNVQNDDGITPLMNAVYMGDDKIVKLLLKYGPDLKIKNNHNKTAYDIAKENDSKYLMKLLKDYEETPSAFINKIVARAMFKDNSYIALAKIPASLMVDEIIALKNSDLFRKIAKNGLLAECFMGLDYPRQNALLLATAKDIMANKELAKQVQTIMQATLDSANVAKSIKSAQKLELINKFNTISR